VLEPVGDEVQLTHQEFALFRVEKPEALDSLVSAYGMLGLSSAAAEVVRVDRWPLWFRLLGRDPGRDGEGYAESEPVEDWLRQGALIDFVLALIALRRDPEARLEFEAAMRDRRPDTPARAAAHRMGRRLWWRPRYSYLTLNEPIWLPEWQQSRAGPLGFDLTDAGLDSAIRALLNPWLGRAPHHVGGRSGCVGRHARRCGEGGV
jgi:hypothetical protein